MSGRIAWGLSGGVALATVFALLDRIDLGEAGWLFDLFSHFPRLIAFGAAVALVVALVLKQMRQAIPAGVAAAVSLMTWQTPAPFASPQTAPDDTAMVRVVSANVHADPAALAALAKQAQAYGADVVSVYEAPTLDDEKLQALFPGLTAIAIRNSADGRGLSKRMLAITRGAATPIAVVSPGGRSNRAVLRYGILAGGRTIQIVAGHPVSPGEPAGMRDRNRLLATLGDGLDTGEPFIVMGDFNASPWSRVFAATPGMRAGDPRFESTFPTLALWLGAPIDHIKFGGGLVLTDYRTGPDIGSDHLPLFATFALPDR